MWINQNKTCRLNQRCISSEEDNPMKYAVPDQTSAYQITLPDNAQMFKALGDETRLRIISLLSQGELCVCDLMEVLNLPQSTTSRHLSYLKNSGWITGTRRGKWMYYRVNAGLPEKSVLNQIICYLAALPDLQADHKELAGHLARKDKQACD